MIKSKFEDYSLDLKFQNCEEIEKIGRYKIYPWVARFKDWGGMICFGETKEDALQKLRAKFEEFLKSGKKLPKPGGKMKIEMAKSNKIEEFEETARIFMKAIFNINLDECFISNESSMWEFHNEKSNEKFFKKIENKFNVDVRGIENAILWKIFRKLKTENDKRKMV